MAGHANLNATNEISSFYVFDMNFGIRWLPPLSRKMHLHHFFLELSIKYYLLFKLKIHLNEM